MGIALWLGCALAVFFLARIVPFARPARWLGELVAALAGAIALGALATALDFGGWNEADWRAGGFVLFGAAGMIGFVRLARLALAEKKQC